MPNQGLTRKRVDTLCGGLPVTVAARVRRDGRSEVSAVVIGLGASQRGWRRPLPTHHVSLDAAISAGVLFAVRTLEHMPAPAIPSHVDPAARGQAALR